MTSRETEILPSGEADIEGIAKAWAKMIKEVQQNGSGEANRTGEASNSQNSNSVRVSEKDNARYMELAERYKNGDSSAADSLREIIRKVAYNNNYVVAASHGTPNGGFTEFGGTQTRNGAPAAGVTWFSEDREHAKVYESHPGGYPEAENPMIYDVLLDVGDWADIGNGRVEALDYSRDGKGAATKDLAKVAKSIAFATQYKHFGQSETARATDIKKQLVNIARDISADFIWQVTETKAFADMCVKEGLKSVVAWEEDKGYNGTKPRMVKTWGVFKTSQIKSSDLVTYDNAGNIIPLTDRFRTDRTGYEAWKNTDIRFSLRDSEIKGIQNLPRVIIGALSKTDLDVLKPMEQYWSTLGKKSPYYRAVHGEWRYSDKTPVVIANTIGAKRGLEKNVDTGWNINIGSKLFGESGHNSRATRTAYPFLAYINSIVRNAILVDTSTMGGRIKSINSLAMHEMYSVADIGNGAELVKLIVEEMYDPNTGSTSKRSYKLTKIQPLTVRGSQINSANLINTTAVFNNVSDLFNVVNGQKYFELALNANRTSEDEATMRRIVDDVARNAGYTIHAYHGSKNIFTAFSKQNRGSSTGTQIAQRWFFAADKETANSYYPMGVLNALGLKPTKYTVPGKLYDLYIRMQKPLEIDATNYDYASHTADKSAFTDESNYAEANGYDGIIITNVIDNNLKPKARESTDYLFKDPNQAKSADLITYDKDGNIIPLTDRFRTDRTGADAWKNNDIRYSTRAQKDAKRIKIETDKPVQASVRQSKSIQQRTMDAVHALVESKKLAEEEAKKYEIVGTTVQKLCDIINNEYVGKLDKNGMPLLPEEGKLSNNIFSNSSYSKDAEPTTECYRQATYRALYKLVTDRLHRPLTNKEQMIVNQAAVEIGVDAPCIYCYSLLDRKAKEAYKL